MVAAAKASVFSIGTKVPGIELVSPHRYMGVGSSCSFERAAPFVFSYSSNGGVRPYFVQPDSNIEGIAAHRQFLYHLMMLSLLAV